MVVAKRSRRLIFRIFYSTTFTFFFLVLVAFILLSAVDAVWQAYKATRYFDIFTIAGVYFLTGLLSVLIFASRIYTNRSIISSIPKTYIPIEAEDVGEKVRELVKEGLKSNAVIAFDARPRYIPEDGLNAPGVSSRLSAETNALRDPKRQKLRAEWVNISHPGWSSPYSPDLPNLQYEVVVNELPSLIEAKAVSLAPPDPTWTNDGLLLNSDPFMTQGKPDYSSAPDPRVVDILQRAVNTSLRDYMAHLMSLNLINPESLSEQFLDLYEYARFSGNPLTESEFRQLMSIFAEILRSMNHLDPDILAEIQSMDPYDDGMGGGMGADFGTSGPPVGQGVDSNDGHSLTYMSSIDSADTQRRYIPESVTGDSASDSSRSLRTAPMFQRRGSSWARSRPEMTPRQVSGRSLRPMRSNTSGTSHNSGRSAGSVIRLTGTNDGALDLPYVIEYPR